MFIEQVIRPKCCWKSEAVAQFSSVKMRFCKTSQISQKTYKMESLFVKLQAVKAATVRKSTSSLAFSCEYVHVKIFFHFYFFVSEKTKAATGHVLWRKMFHKFCKFHRKHLCWSLFLMKLQVFKNTYFE